ncbi:MAG: AAC(3) family N-acetyltransferase, partial [Candidatus Latescibacteria bacterium]|nr:AAC(3) family N-acetyltransferase [Candidatus Latescibacterota bacterium]
VPSPLKGIGEGARPLDVISALRAVVGDEGTLVFPTFTSREESCFIPEATESVMGAVAETFRKMPGVIRSRHPRHPVAAQGPAACELTRGHENATGPCGADTPFHRHAMSGGQILLIGVDLDTLTLLHTAEALLDLPYLRELKGTYRDESGVEHTISMRHAPGGHRGGIHFLEKLLRRKVLIKYGSFGHARTILMDAGSVLDELIDALTLDPMAALCRHENCPDCETFKGAVRRAALLDLGAQVCFLIHEPPHDTHGYEEMIARYGYEPEYRLMSGLPVVTVGRGESPPASHGVERPLLRPDPRDLPSYRTIPEGYAGIVYAPLEAARAGLQPFYDVLYRGRSRGLITDIIVEDGLADLPGFVSPKLGAVHFAGLSGSHVTLGTGQAQLREIVSAMRMRNFKGRYHVVVPAGDPFIETRRIMSEFYELLP